MFTHHRISKKQFCGGGEGFHVINSWESEQGRGNAVAVENVYIYVFVPPHITGHA